MLSSFCHASRYELPFHRRRWFYQTWRIIWCSRYTKCFRSSVMLRGMNCCFHWRPFYGQLWFILCGKRTSFTGASGSIDPMNLVFIASRSHRLRLHFVQVSGQNDWGRCFKFGCMIVFMNTNRTKLGANCARLRAIRLLGCIMVASMNREYQGRPVQVVQSAAQLLRGAHGKNQVRRRIYARPSNQAVKVSLHICRTFRRKVMAYV
jgi:hypothetical protein